MAAAITVAAADRPRDATVYAYLTKRVKPPHVYRLALWGPGCCRVGEAGASRPVVARMPAGREAGPPMPAREA